MFITKSKSLLLLDCKAMCHIAKHAYKETANGMLYGFFNNLLQIKERFPNSIPIFIWDGRHLLREDVYPGYKKKRGDTDQTEYDLVCLGNMDYIRYTLLGDLGFKNNYGYEGYEADDIMASLSEKYPSIIVAEDQDMLQMLSPTCIIYHPVKRKVVTMESFKKTTTMTPREFREVKGIAGCTTDEVPGIVGVGQKTALQYVRGELKEVSKAHKLITNGAETLALTRRLTQLPYEGSPVPTIRYQKFKTEAFVDFCNEFKFRGFLIRLHKFERSFIRDGI